MSGILQVVAASGGIFVFNKTISSDTVHYNLRNDAINAGWDTVRPLKATVTINSGIYVYASSTGSYAFDTGSPFPAGSTLDLINNGEIQGMGGVGGAGAGGYMYTTHPAADAAYGGAGGGPALNAAAAISIDNTNGAIRGGGGGGGGGGSAGFYTEEAYSPYNTIVELAEGSGGGGGRGKGAASGGGHNAWGGYAPTYYDYGNSGSSGSGTGAGAGGAAATIQFWAGYPQPGTMYAGAGGTGGAGGSSGSSGGSGYASAGYPNGSASSGAGGGSGGNCTNGNANITWIAVGTREGTLG